MLPSRCTKRVLRSCKRVLLWISRVKVSVIGIKHGFTCVNVRQAHAERDVTNREQSPKLSASSEAHGEH